MLWKMEIPETGKCKIVHGSLAVLLSDAIKTSCFLSPPSRTFFSVRTADFGRDMTILRAFIRRLLCHNRSYEPHSTRPISTKGRVSVELAIPKSTFDVACVDLSFAPLDFSLERHQAFTRACRFFFHPPQSDDRGSFPVVVNLSQRGRSPNASGSIPAFWRVSATPKH